MACVHPLCVIDKTSSAWFAGAALSVVSEDRAMLLCDRSTTRMYPHDNLYFGPDPVLPVWVPMGRPRLDISSPLLCAYEPLRETVLPYLPAMSAVRLSECPSTASLRPGDPLVVMGFDEREDVTAPDVWDHFVGVHYRAVYMGEGERDGEYLLDVQQPTPGGWLGRSLFWPVFHVRDNELQFLAGLCTGTTHKTHGVFIGNDQVISALAQH